MHTDHAGIALIMPVHNPFSHQGIADRRIHKLCQFADFLRRPGDHGAASYIDKRTLGCLDQFHCPVNIFLSVFHQSTFLFQLHFLIVTYVRCHVLCNIHKHRARTSFSRNGKRLPYSVRQLRNILYNITMLGDGHCHAGNIHLLESIFAKEGKHHIACDRNHGNRIHIGRCDSCDQVGRPRPAGSKAYANLSGRPCISVRRMGCTLFMGS